MVGQPHQNFMKMASWSRVSEHLVNLIGMSDQLKWNNQMVRLWIFKALMMILKLGNGWKGLRSAGKVDYLSENGASRTTYVSRPTTAG